MVYEMWICYYTDITNQLTTRLTLISIASARKHIPNVNILMVYPDWHFLEQEIYEAATDTVKIRGLDRQWHYDKRRCLANAEVIGDCLFLDTDIIIQEDVSGVFSHSFDICVTRREHMIEAAIPYNMGVAFTRSREFWRHVALQIPNGNHWRDSELAFSKIAMIRSEYTVRELPGRFYNRIPLRAGDDVSEASIVHYKGQRKNWMLAREKEFI